MNRTAPVNFLLIEHHLILRKNLFHSFKEQDMTPAVTLDDIEMDVYDRTRKGRTATLRLTYTASSMSLSVDGSPLAFEASISVLSPDFADELASVFRLNGYPTASGGVDQTTWDFEREPRRHVQTEIQHYDTDPTGDF